LILIPYSPRSKDTATMPKRGYSMGLKVACRPMSAPTEKPLDVFISYSHKDEALKEELEVHCSGH